MKFQFVLTLAVLLSLIACKPSGSSSTENEATKVDSTTIVQTQIPGLKRLWDTETVLTTSESVLYDKTDNLLYVSCINGVPPDKKDGDGFIAKVGLDGSILQLKWATGLNAPKGMGLTDKFLYVTDIDRLVAIDRKTGKISQTWKVEGASFLNDVQVLDDGAVYFTDSNTHDVWMMMKDNLTKMIGDTTLGGPNGILIEGNDMFLACFMSGNVSRMDRSTKKITTLASEIPGGDGIERFGEGLLVSNWNGEVYYISMPSGEVTEILDTQEAKLNAADIEVIADKNLLLVPTFFGNGVTAYELSKPQ